MALGPIFNANTRLLNENSGTLPDVSGGILDYMQPMTFDQITKTVVNFQVVETTTPINFYGMWQPLDQPLDMRAEGQRKWSRYRVYTQLAVPLTPDDVVVYLGNQYRVLPTKQDFQLYGYFYYDMEEDFTGSGPVTA